MAVISWSAHGVLFKLSTHMNEILFHEAVFIISAEISKL
jgi:hypothetical protein